MTTNPRSFATTAALGVTLAVLAPVAAAHANPAQASKNKETFTLVATSEAGPYSVIATGAFTAGGSIKAGGSGDLIRFAGGTLTIKHPSKDAHFHQHTDRKTCYVTGTVMGTYTVGHGTGHYTGITGHGHYRSSFTEIDSRTKSGSCTEKTKPQAYQDVIVATGPISGSA